MRGDEDDVADDEEDSDDEEDDGADADEEDDEEEASDEEEAELRQQRLARYRQNVADLEAMIEKEKAGKNREKKIKELEKERDAVLESIRLCGLSESSSSGGGGAVTASSYAEVSKKRKRDMVDVDDINEFKPREKIRNMDPNAIGGIYEEGAPRISALIAEAQRQIKVLTSPEFQYLLTIALDDELNEETKNAKLAEIQSVLRKVFGADSIDEKLSKGSIIFHLHFSFPSLVKMMETHFKDGNFTEYAPVRYRFPDGQERSVDLKILKLTLLIPLSKKLLGVFIESNAVVLDPEQPDDGFTWYSLNISREKALGQSDPSKFSQNAKRVIEEIKNGATSLDLSRCDLNDADVVEIAEAMKANKTLQRLDLNNNQIGDAGAIALSESLVGNTSLKYLYLYENGGITDKSLPALKRTLQTTNITDMGFEGTSISEEAQKELKALIEANYQRMANEELQKLGANSIVNEHLQAFTEALAAGDAVALNRGKLMMTGPGRAGKTATVRSLLGKPFDPNLESTIGADANQTCSVDRNENVVNWEEVEREGEFAEHSARAVAERMKKKQKNGGNENENASTVRRPSSSRMAHQVSDELSSFAGMTSAAASVAASAFSASSSTSAEKVVIIPKDEINLKDDEMAMKMFNEEMILKNLNGEDTKIALSIWDLGGQEVFYALHHLFLTKYAVYLCIFDMRAMASEDEKVRASSMNFTDFWLRSIQIHAPGAPVFLIGTFKDMVADPKQHKAINRILLDKFKFSEKFPAIVMNREDKLTFWPIDNTKGGDDSVIVRLRAIILECVGKMDHISMKVPLAWTLILDKLMATKKSSITMSEVFEIALQNNVISKYHVTGMLALFHELGMILHFSKSDELSDLVVLDPQWLVDAITKVIRDFNLHKYDEEDDVVSEALMDFPSDFNKLKDEAIVSVRLLNFLWKSEDDESETDFTRRNFLLSLMENMTLFCAWRFGEMISNEEGSEAWASIDISTETGSFNARRVFQQLPPPTEYLIPSNLRLFRPQEIEGKIQKNMGKDLPIMNLNEFNEKRTTRYGFVIDFSGGFMPMGLFDRFVCLLVAYSSRMFEDSRYPLLAKGSTLLSFGLNEFRVDEYLSQNRIIVTIAEKADRNVILEAIESMLAKLNDEVMSGRLVYRILIVIWIENDHYFVELEKAREATRKKAARIRDVNNETQISFALLEPWMAPTSATQKDENISLKMPDGKSNHAYLLYSRSATSEETITMLHRELTEYGVKIAEPSTEAQKGIDSSMCIVLLLTGKVFEDENILIALRYVQEKKIPVIVVQSGSEDVSMILDQAPLDIQTMFSNCGTPLMLKQIYSHERDAFIHELVGGIKDICSRNELIEPKDEYLAFFSHYKKEAGGTARLIQMTFESRCNARQSEKPELLKGARAYLDSDNLRDLRLLLDHVQKSKVLVVLLTKGYFTRPWCLTELHAAIEKNVPIITINVAGGGYDFDEGKRFLSTLTQGSLNEANNNAIPPLEELGIDVAKLGAKLAEVIPNLTAIPFDPSGSMNQINGAIDDLIDRILAHYQ